MKKIIFLISFLVIKINGWDYVRFKFEELRKQVLTDLDKHLNKYDDSIKKIIQEFDTKYRMYDVQRQILYLIQNQIEDDFDARLKEDFRKFKYNKPDDPNLKDLLIELDRFFYDFSEMNGSLFVRRNLEFFKFLQDHYPKLVKENQFLNDYIERFKNKFIDPVEDNIIIVQEMEGK